MEDPTLEALAWLFEKPAEEIIAEAEVAALRSMFLVEDSRTEHGVNESNK
jgi:hypothetical protein